MTAPTHRARRLTVCTGENGIRRHKPLCSEIVHRAHAAEDAGAGVLADPDPEGRKSW
ncbi:hypothetical protein ACF1BE_19195 [Streptomyces sp. NPDC014991]|uniref:hypothetical protein n=1 Tax=Streptomyces sp. NPDC014991 TaxID=3364935 RepID=UPI0036FAB12A